MNRRHFQGQGSVLGAGLAHLPWPRRPLAVAVNKNLPFNDIEGLLLTPGSIADFARFQNDDMARSARIIREGGIRAE